MPHGLCVPALPLRLSTVAAGSCRVPAEMEAAAHPSPATPFAQDEENTILYEAQAKHGNKWAKISQLLPGRTDNQVKNHFYSTMRRTVRKVSERGLALLWATAPH